MSSGNRYQNTSETDGRNTYVEWSGANDPVNKTAENNYSKRVHLKVDNPYIMWWLTPSVHEAHHGFGFYGTASNKPSWSANSENELLAKLVNDYRGHEFHAGKFAGEFGKTLESLKGAIRAFFNVFAAFKHGDLSGAIRSMARLVHGDVSSHQRKRVENALISKVRGRKGVVRYYDRNTGIVAYKYPKDLNTQDISGLWLALKYGWTPLLQDVYEAAKYIENVTSDPRVLKSRYGRVQPTLRVDDRVAGADYAFIVEHNVRRAYRCVWVEELSTARSLGLTDPLGVLWECTPYSFVVDWFIPIGNYLDNLSIVPSMSGSFHRSTKYVSTGFRRVTPCGPKTYSREYPHDIYCCPWMGDQQIKSIEGGGSYVRDLWFEREAYVYLSVPPPGFKTLEKALSLGHIANAAALIHQLVSKHR